MGSVIGPISLSDWRLMSDLLQDLKDRDRSRFKFPETYDKEKDLYKYVKEQYI